MHRYDGLMIDDCGTRSSYFRVQSLTLYRVYHKMFSLTMSETRPTVLNRRAFAAFAFILLSASKAMGFQSPSIPFGPQTPSIHRRIHSFMAVDGSKLSLMEEAAELKARAERMRLEAERQEAALTLSKIESLERKLADDKWLAKHRDEEPQLIRQLDDLTNRLQREKASPADSARTTTKPTVSMKFGTATTTTQRESTSMTSSGDDLQVPEYGFVKKELDLYLPVAKEIESRMVNATIEEKLGAFRESPQLKDYFQSKIEELFLGPLKEFQRLDYLKEEYMKSTSSSEKDQLKREMQNLENSIDDGSLLVCDSIYKELPPLTEEYVEARIKAISSLPPVLQAFYKRNVNVALEDDLRFAIELDHFEPQLDLLYRIDNSTPLTEDQLAEAMQAFASLSPLVKDRFAQELGLENGKDASAVLKKLEGKGSWSPQGNTITIPEKEIFAELDFQDRSRWVEEMLPSLAQLEEFAPTEEQMAILYSQVLKKSFAPLTKPERVKGGYFIRGQNYFQGEVANDKLMDALRRKIDASPLAGKVQMFYIFDPSPATDEEIEFGNDFRPVLFVAGGTPKEMYDPATPVTKGLVSMSAIFFMAAFALGAYGVNDSVMDQLQAAINSGDSSLSLVLDLLAPIVLPLGAIQLSHEAAHRVVAWKNKVRQSRSFVASKMMLTIRMSLFIRV